MRISSSYFFQNGLRGMQQVQKQLVDTQERISTGQKFLRTSEDPVAATRTAIFEEKLKITEQFQENITYAQNSNQMAESVLSEIENSLNRVRELAIQANSSQLNEDDIRSIASEIEGITKEIANLMNSKDGVGDYLFSGFQGLEKPFIERSGGGYEYRGDSGERVIQISSETRVSFSFSGKPVFVDVESSTNTLKTSAALQNDSASTAFITVGEVRDQETFDSYYPDDYMITFNDPPSTYNIINRDTGAPMVGDSPPGNLTNVPYQPGSPIVFNGIEFTISGEPSANDTFFIESTPQQDILTGLYRFSQLLRDAAANPDNRNTITGESQFQEYYSSSLSNIDAALLSVSKKRSSIGVILQQLDRVNNMHEGLIVEVNSFLSETRDLDFAEAATLLQQESFILQASQASFTRISGLTIFNYL